MSLQPGRDWWAKLSQWEALEAKERLRSSLVASSSVHRGAAQVKKGEEGIRAGANKGRQEGRGRAVAAEGKENVAGALVRGLLPRSCLIFSYLILYYLLSSSLLFSSLLSSHLLFSSLLI